MMLLKIVQFLEFPAHSFLLPKLLRFLPVVGWCVGEWCYALPLRVVHALIDLVADTTWNQTILSLLTIFI